VATLTLQRIRDSDKISKIDMTDTDILDRLNTVTSVEQNDNLPARCIPDVDDYYSTLDTYTRMAARGEQNGVIVVGRPGIAKSYQIEETLKDEVERNDSTCWNYCIRAGYVSPMALYETLYENQAEGNVLVLDDVDGVADHDTAASLLKGALEGQGSSEKRMVEWDSNSNKLGDDVPSSFEFRGTIIMVFNEVPDGNEHFHAVKSRSMHYDLKFTFEERMQLIKEVAKAPYTGLTYDDRMEVANWLIEYTTSEMDNVDLRSLFKCFDLRKSSVLEGDEWKLHAAEQLGISKDTIIGNELLKGTDSVKKAAQLFADNTHHNIERFFHVMGEDIELQLIEELDEEYEVKGYAIEEYEKITGNSRATYYRRLDSTE